MSLKSKCETAVLNLLKTDPRLRACYPKPSLTAEERTDFPSLWVRAQRPAQMYPETPIFKVPVQIVLETQFDYPFHDKLFSRIERFVRLHAMIDPINSLSGLGLHVFDNLPGEDAETINPSFKTQTCGLTLVCCETC